MNITYRLQYTRPTYSQLYIRLVKLFGLTTNDCFIFLARRRLAAVAPAVWYLATEKDRDKFNFYLRK